MHSEFCQISQETADTINETRKKGGRVICVGTTSCRTIESWAAEDGTLSASAGWTNIFIYPGYRFKVLDALITNFHLPESTLIMLVSALAGRGEKLYISPFKDNANIQFDSSLPYEISVLKPFAQPMLDQIDPAMARHDELEHVLAAYEEAVREKYRFFSFGDAMFIADGIE